MRPCTLVELLAQARAAAAEKSATNVEFVEGEAEQLPLPEGSFDVRRQSSLFYTFHARARLSDRVEFGKGV